MASFAQPVLDKITVLEQQRDRIVQLQASVAPLVPAQGSYAAPAKGFESCLRDWVHEEIKRDPEGFAQKLCDAFKASHFIRSSAGGYHPDAIEAPQWLKNVEQHLWLGRLKDDQGVPYNGDVARMKQAAQAKQQYHAQIKSDLADVRQSFHQIERSLHSIPEDPQGRGGEAAYAHTYDQGGMRHAFRCATSGDYRAYAQAREKVETQYGTTLDELQARQARLGGQMRGLAEKNENAECSARAAASNALAYQADRMSPATLFYALGQPAFELLRQPQVFDRLQEQHADQWAFGETLTAAYQGAGAAFRVAPVLDKMRNVVGAELAKAQHAAKSLSHVSGSRMAGRYYSDRAGDISATLGGAATFNDKVLSQVEHVLSEGTGPLPQTSKLHDVAGLGVGKPPASPVEQKQQQEAERKKDRSSRRSGISFAQRAASAVM